MLTKRALLALVFAVSLPATGAFAALSGPAEIPPASYTEPQYIDSAGCLFIRAGTNNNVTWVPMVDANRKQMCGYPPTFGGSIGTGSQPAPIPAPAPVPAPIEPPAAPALTLAQICEGKYGIQRGYVLASTGQPVDCGPAPLAEIAPVVALPEAAPAPRRMTLAQACAEIAATGRSLINAATGLPVVCANPDAALAQSHPAQDAPEPATVPQFAAMGGACPEGMYDVTAYHSGGSGFPLQCRAEVARTGALARAPLSNPTGAAAHAAVSVPAGYAPVFDDGRLNPMRGLVQTASAGSARLSTMSHPAAHFRYVQIGSFAQRANAQGAAARVVALGYGVRLVGAGGGMVVLAGPFADSPELAQALSALRDAGYIDAFARR